MSENSKDKTGFTEPYLKGSIVCNAKRDKKNTNFARRKAPHTLWWDLLNSLVLQKIAIEVVPATANSFISERQALPSDRTDSGHYLCHNLRHSSPKQNENPSRKWSISANSRAKKFSLCKQSKAIFKKSQSPNDSKHQQSVRLYENEDVLSSPRTNEFIVGLRFHCLDGLWEIHRGGKSRIQPTQKRCAFLPSLALFRILPERILAWNFKARECIHLIWISRFLKRMPGENTPLYLSHSSTGRFRILRPQIYRDFRAEEHWLCHCSQTYSAHKKKDYGLKISRFPQGLGSSNVPISTISLGKTSPVYSYPQKATPKSRRSDDSIYDQPIFLSSLCEQSFFEARECLVFLQGASKHRERYSGSKGRLCISQNSHQNLSSKSTIFSFASSGIQYYQLVQTNLPTTEISEMHTADHTLRDIGSTGKIGKNRQSEFAKITIRLYLKAIVGTCYSEN